MTSEVARHNTTRVFISYSHDSPEHEDRVLALADRLRQDGVDATIDQYADPPPDGWPMWMNLQIQNADFVLLVCTETYRRRADLQEQPGKGRGVLWEAKLIYNCLYVAAPHQKFIPILFDGGDLSYIPAPLQGLAHYRLDTSDGYEDVYRHLTKQPRHSAPEIGQLKALPAIAPRSYPASMEAKVCPEPPNTQYKRSRLAVLKRVRRDWIDGLLKQSLYRIARIELGLESRADAVDQPLNTIVQVPDCSPVPIPEGTTIGQLLDENGALLILGAPGTGKTTLLLELAQQLLDRAENDQNQPIPVVFNLSSWGVRHQPLLKWLVAELNERSDVPTITAERWLETEQVLPLLDGLDEVAADQRQACIEAINSFRRDHGLLPIAVCSRIVDYEAVGKKLRMRNAVVIQPLTRLQVHRYLERVGKPLEILRTSFDRDRFLGEFLETPLMLCVAMLAYRNAPVEVLAGDTFDQRRDQLFAKFVDAMFERRSSQTGYTAKQTLHWLTCLASTLTRHNLTIFYLEDLTVDWLPTRTQRLLTRFGIVVASGPIFGLIGWLIPDFTYGLWFGLLSGIVLALIMPLIELRPVESFRFRFDNPQARNRALGYLFVGLVMPLVGLSLGLLGLIVGLFFGLIIVLIGGLTTLLSTEAVEKRVRPNQGTRRSTKVALWLGLTVGTIGGLPAGLLDVGFGLIVGVIGGITAGMIGGGFFSGRHYLVRLVLAINRWAPLTYVHFLDFAAERLFLRKVGGGYIFVHRMFLDYLISTSQRR